MDRKFIKAITLQVFASILALSVTVQGRAQDVHARYATMAPVSAYLMSDRSAEIALARSAAPSSISKEATVLVLGPSGYLTAIKGSNGFTCFVDRSWTKAFDDDNFWNPKVRTPICFNPQASRTVVPYSLFATKLALAGATEAAIRTGLTRAVADKQLPVPENGSMAYMMSKNQYIDDHVKAWYSHIMIYTPKALGANAGASWGADRSNSPVVYDTSHLLWPQPWALFFVPVSHWSDGTSAPM